MMTTIYTAGPSMVQMVILSVLMVAAIVALWYAAEDMAKTFVALFGRNCRRKPVKTNRATRPQYRRPVQFVPAAYCPPLSKEAA
ncbi:MAG: hypothetical protein E7409_06640 [Ruminococcaceae bacterium]|nr:hypothetical protein [Oscillospiraceae bacterium]